MVITRFAPSPTGLLHIGNIRTAIIAWLCAKKEGGKFILRIDDTDQERSKQEFVSSIKEDLSWMCISWDDLFHQTDRMANYQMAIKKLISSGRLYPCYESAEELAMKKRERLSQGLPPIYDRSALKLSDSEKKRLEQKGVQPHWRFLIKKGKIAWHDKIRGYIEFDSAKLSDPVLIRTDKSLTYSLASVVDDIDYKITDIIRGEDHIANSAIHIQIFEALGVQAPYFSHAALMKIKQQKLSKREGGYSIKEIRQMGVLPQTLFCYLAKIGSSDSFKPEAEIDNIINEFCFTKMSRASVIYDEESVRSLNIKKLRRMSFAEALPHLKKIGLVNLDQDFWLSIKDNINSFADAKIWWDICKESLKGDNTTDVEIIDIARKELPDGEFNQDSWGEWVERIKKQTSKRGKELFQPLRFAITGSAKGPELDKILPLISRDILIKRLQR